MKLRALVVCLLWAVILTASYALPQTEESTTGPTAPDATSPPAASGPSVDDAKKHGQAASDAANKVESAIAAAREARIRVERYLADITRIIGAEPKPSSSPLDDLRSIDAAVAALQEPTPDLIQRLANVKEALGSAEAARATPCDLSTFKDAAPEVAVAQGKCSDAQKHAADETSKLDAAITGIRKALGDLYPYAAKQVSAMAERLGPLQSLQPGDASPAAEPLLQILPRNLPILRQVVTEGAEYQIRWERTKLRLEKLKITAPEGSADAKANDAAQSAINSIVPKLEGWFTVLGTFAQTSAKDLDSKISEVETDPARNSSAAIEASRDKSEVVAELQSVVDAWPPMVAYLVDGKPSNFNLKTTKKNFDVLQSSLNTLRGAVSRLNDAVAGDFSQFETDQVSLYYFTDVKRLMFALNPAVREIGGVAEAQEQAAAQRKKLSESEFELADAQASVNRYQKQVLDLQEQQRQIQSKLKGQDSKVSRLASRLKQAQIEKGKTATDAQNASDDPAKVADAAKAKSRDEAAAKKESEAQSDYDAAKSDRDATQSQLDAAKGDSSGLPAQIDEAKQALSTAQAAVSEQRRKMLMAAEAESDAFAFARDNTPFLWAQAVGSSTDPAKRVVLYAFNDNKTIFMRGKPDDLAKVRRIIADFDRPAPQARLTLWTFELNSEANQKANVQAAKRLNRSMEIVDEELGDTRALVNTTLTLLRDLINDKVRSVASRPFGAICAACTAADWEKLGRVIGFYDPAVLTQLGFNTWNPAGVDYGALLISPWKVDVTLLRKLIPDPAGTTTLGEALLVLSLAKPTIKVDVRSEFESTIGARLKALSVSPKLDTCAWKEEDPDSACPEDSARPMPDPNNGKSKYLLPLTWHALSIWESGAAGTGGGLTSSELEIARALRTSYDTAQLRQLADRLESWYGEINQLEASLSAEKVDMAKLIERGKAKLKPAGKQQQLTKLWEQRNNIPKDKQQNFNELVGEAIGQLPPEDQEKYDQLDISKGLVETRRDRILNGSTKVVKELQSYGIDVDDLVDPAASPGDAKKSIFRIAALRVLKSPGLSSASPRVAAADQMLKEIVIAIEDDLSRLFVQPMIRGLRVRLMAEGVRVGILQRESLLATNRGKARIDPRASAQLAVGEEQDILTGIQQLAQLYTVVQSGGALAALGALQSHPREPQPEIFALTTGNKFEVTPIFDPSGQALRFKFDYVSSSRLQEPNGSTDPQFPRIERHTVNTEVQLSNLETREISRFESNARLGLATRYWGGVPVLKDIPYVRPWVPLIGWFVRKGGSNAVAQQSVIFGQTTIYPTIGSLIDLLSDQGSSGGSTP